MVCLECQSPDNSRCRGSSVMARLVEGQGLRVIYLVSYSEWRPSILRAAAQASPEQQEGIVHGRMDK